MKFLSVIVLGLFCLGIAGCDGATNTTTKTKTEVEVDRDGNRTTKTKTETVTRQDAEVTRVPVEKRETVEVRERTIELKKDDPIIKVGPLEVHD